ncbi:type II secretion system protein [Marinobacter salarius]|nr:type II secretion system protein [Marinobacter salarius]
MSSGFTIVELVMVIILIGVISALGVGLFASRSVFSPLLATQQLASATLLAQQAALAGNAANSLTIEQTAEEFQFTVGARAFALPRAETSLSVAGGLPLTVTFGADGSPGAGTNIEFTFTGDSTFESCLSSLGAVYRGSCQL